MVFSSGCCKLNCIWFGYIPTSYSVHVLERNYLWVTQNAFTLHGKILDRVSEALAKGSTLSKGTEYWSHVSSPGECLTNLTLGWVRTVSFLVGSLLAVSTKWDAFIRRLTVVVYETLQPCIFALRWQTFAFRKSANINEAITIQNRTHFSYFEVSNIFIF